MKNQRLALVCLTISLLFVNSALAVEWPQEIVAAAGTIVVYQPQPESLSGNVLTGRAAMSIELKDKDEPIYGVFWFSSKIETDRDKDQVIISNFKVEKVGWPGSKDASEQRFTKVVEDALVTSAFTMELSRLTASLSAAEKVQESLEGIKNDPPEIMFSESLAVHAYEDTFVFVAKHAL